MRTGAIRGLHKLKVCSDCEIQLWENWDVINIKFILSIAFILEPIVIQNLVAKM